LAGEWVSPLNAKVRQPFIEVKKLTDKVADVRKFFTERKEGIPREAVAAWEEIKKTIPTPDTFASTSIEDMEAAQAKLQPVIDNFGTVPKDINDCTVAARSRNTSLSTAIKERRAERQQTDRKLVCDTLRRYRSLDPDVLPNSVMNSDFANARRAWQQLLDNDQLKSPRYRAFAKERIEALRYIENLFVQFMVDVRKTDDAKKGEGPLKDLKSVFVTESGRDFTFNFDKGDPPDPSRFYLSRRYKGKNVMTFSSMPADWIYEHAFREPGSAPEELRWREVTPILRFSVGLYLFETMQYDEAVAHFEKLVSDETYGSIATSFAERSRKEAEARAEYLGLLKQFREAGKATDVEGVLTKLKTFGQRHEGTLFYIDVMDAQQKLSVDIYPGVADADSGELKFPKMPPAPAK
ncbi:MAG: hypothetical protein AAGD14_19415, partial [Planctomycetota bacterium]